MNQKLSRRRRLFILATVAAFAAGTAIAYNLTTLSGLAFWLGCVVLAAVVIGFAVALLLSELDVDRYARENRQLRTQLQTAQDLAGALVEQAKRTTAAQQLVAANHRVRPVDRVLAAS